MVIMILLISMGAGGDFDPAKTYEFIEKGNGPVEKRQVFGRILEKRPDGWLVEIDAPWESRRVVTLRDAMLESGPLLETEAMRDKRIEDGWAAKGFTKETTASGETVFIASREADLARRARKAAPAAPEPFPIPTEALLALEQPATTETADTDAQNAGFPWAKRSAQGVLIIVAALLAAIVAKTMVLTES